VADSGLHLIFMSMQAAASVSLDIFCEHRYIHWLSAFCPQRSLPEIFLADVWWVGGIGGSDPVRFGRRKKPLGPARCLNKKL